MNWKNVYNKMFPAEKTLTDKQLKRQRLGNNLLSLMFVSLAAVVALTVLPSAARLADMATKVSIVALTAGGIGGLFAVSVHYSVIALEAKFELRIREALTQYNTSTNSATSTIKGGENEA